MISLWNLRRCICILLIGAISSSVFSISVLCQDDDIEPTYTKGKSDGTTIVASGQAGTGCYIKSVSNSDEGLPMWLYVDSNNNVGLSDKKTLWKITKIRTYPAIYSISSEDYLLAGGSNQWDSVWLTKTPSNKIYWQIINIGDNHDIYTIRTYELPDKCRKDARHCIYGTVTSTVGVGCYVGYNTNINKENTAWKLYGSNNQVLQLS